MFKKFSSHHLIVFTLVNVNRVWFDGVIKRVWFPFPIEGPCSHVGEFYQTLCMPSNWYGFHIVNIVFDWFYNLKIISNALHRVLH